MPRLLHIGDLHLGYEHRYLGTRAPERAAESVHTFERIVEWALEPSNDITALLIAGDVFETHTPDSKLVGQVVAPLSKLVRAGKTVITVPGNHDEYSYPESIYRQQGDRWPGILVTSPTPRRVARLDLAGTPCDIYSLAYTAGLSPNRLPAIDTAGGADVRVALLHGTLDANPSDRSYRIDSQTLKEAVIQYTALGHIHKPDQVRIGDGWAVYPGTPIGKGFDDPGVDYLIAVSFNGGVPTIEHVPFASRRIETRTLDLGRCDTFDRLIAGLEEHADSELILRLVMSGPRPPEFDADHLRGRLAGRFYHLEIDDLSVEISDGEIASLEHQPTMRGLFAQLMHRQLEEATAKSDARQLQRLRLALRRGLTAFEEAGRAQREAG